MRATSAAVSSSFRRYCAIWSSCSAIGIRFSPELKEKQLSLVINKVCAATKFTAGPLCILRASDSSISFERLGCVEYHTGHFAESLNSEIGRCFYELQKLRYQNICCRIEQSHHS